MTFEEAIVTADGKFQVWDIDVKDGRCALMIFTLTNAGAKQLAGRYVPEAERDSVMADLKARGFQVGATDYNCNFVWFEKTDGVEVYDLKRKVFDATGDRADTRRWRRRCAR